MPLKHKENNTVKFLPFADRLANVDIDVIHRVGHRYEESEDDLELFFRETLEKWTTLNCTQRWGDFRKSVADIRTLPQLVLLKERVVNELVIHINMQDPLTLQPILEMVVAAAKDLRQEFYPHYPAILQSVVSILSSKNVEVLEWVFNCLAHLFKLLWRCMVQNIGPVLTSLIPLLSSKKPKYINHFAADSFAFLARKVRDPQAFLVLVVKEIEKQPDSLAGCGRLVFSWLRGVKKQFHSCARTLFPMFLRSLGDESIPAEVLCDLLSHTLQHIAVDIRRGGTSDFWTAALAVMGHFINEYKTCTSDEERTKVEAKIRRLLTLEKLLIEYDDGAQLTHASNVATQLTDLLSLTPTPSETLLSVITDSSTSVLLSASSNLPQQIATKLTHTLLKLPHTTLLLKLTEQLLDWGSFDSLVLPSLLELCNRAICERGTTSLEVSLLAQLIIHKAPPLQDGSDLDHINGYVLDFSSAIQKSDHITDVSSLFISHLSSLAKSDELLSSIERISKLLLILPHVRPIEEEDAKSAVKNLLDVLLSSLERISEAKSPERDTSMLLFALLSAFECLIRFQCDLSGVVPVNRILKTLLPFAQDGERFVLSLRLLDVYFSGETLKNMPVEEADKLIDQLLESLIQNFSNPYHQVRFLTCRIFSLVPASPELQNLYSLCLKAESTEASISEYRDKLQFLQRLECDAIRTSLLNHQTHLLAPLHLLLGSLYVNFQLVWQPVQLTIASYAQSLPVDTFWPVFFSRLSLSPKDQQLVSSKISAEFSSDYLSERFNNLTDFEDRPDHFNFRLLLWQTGVHFSEVCEKRNRDVVASFLTFVNNEYLKTNSDMASSWNVKQNSELNDADDESSDTEDEDEKDDEKEKDEEEKDEDAPPTKRKRKNTGAEEDAEENEETSARIVKRKRPQRAKEESTKIRLLTKTLQAALTLMSKMRNPKVLFCEPEVKKLYYELLSHKNDEVQKAALDCILTYRNKNLTQYSERLYALTDSKKFKNEMIAFRIDKESDMIQSEHREDLIPVIMRIVHSKMSARTGLRTGGKGGSALRRSMVLRFLAGCQEEEMLIFFQMAFRFFCKQIEDEPVTLVNKIMSSLDLENVVPPRRLQSATNLLSVVLERFGGLMGPRLLQLVLRLLLCVGATATGLLDQRESMHVGYVNAVRQLRISCLNILTTFFDRLTTYEWTEGEIVAILKVFVWPLLPRLKIEGIHSPTALFKLFAVWSQHSRYIPLLGARSPEDLTPLSALMELMLGQKTNPAVSNAVVEMVESLLTLADHDAKNTPEDNLHNEYQAPPIPVPNPMVIDDKQIESLQLSEEINMGSKLLLPHVEAVLERLHTRLAATKPGRGMGLTVRELTVLSSISELVRTPASSASLVRLLLPMVARRATIPVEDDESVLKMLTSLKNLVPNVENAAEFVRQLAPLFSVIRGADARRKLVGLTEAVASTTSDEKVATFARLAAEFNATDARWVQQPDFDRQLSAYKEAGKMIEGQTMTADVGALVMHQCFYVAKIEKDLSLRDSAGHCMKLVGSGLAQQLKEPEEIKFFVDDIILELIRGGIRSKESSELRERSVLLLGEMARNCGNLHPVLRDCSFFANKEDIEVDFFENLQHLQLFRRNRALLKFSEIAQKLEITPSARTLTQFMLPLVSQFLCNESYVKKNTIIDAAIDAVGIICRLLPWRPYEAILQFNLMRLRGNALYQKQLIRVVVSILDAFHFDLSRAKGEKPLPVKTDENDAAKEKEEEKEETVDESKLEEVLKEGLEDINDEEKDDGEEKEMDTSCKQTVLAIERISNMSPSAARRVMQSIAVGFLPQLHRVLTARTIMDGVHRFNKKLVGKVHDDKDAEDEEIRRIPVALAVVKLLQRLPEAMLTTYLPGIFAKLCNYLKSRLESIRRVTRETMHKIMFSLGPSYLSTLLQEMTSLLNRGFFVHVLVYTMHSVIVSIQELFKQGDIDKCVQDVLAVCKVDLFGAPAEDKEEGKVAKKVQEARSTKSLDTLHLLAKYVSESCLIDLLVPFKAVIQSAHSHKIVNRVSECLRQIVLGLSENCFISGNALLLFGLGVASESVPILMIKKRAEKTEAQKEKEARRRPDSFLLPEEPKRHIGIKSTDAARTAARMNAHVLVEFGLRLILVLLKHEQIRASDEDDAVLLDSLVPLLKDCIGSKHVQLSTLSLQCLAWVIKMDLPSLKSNIDGIASSTFALLHKYAAAGLSKGDNFDMVMAAFKTIAVLVRDVKSYTLTNDQLKVLLLYAEQDLNDVQRHATAFGLLRAILARKLIAPEIHDVMGRVATVSITSEVAHVRVQARNVFHHFLLDYPLGKKLKRHLLFYVSQLSYDVQSGRESALEMINTVISTFPITTLKPHASMLFVALGARLVNEDSPDCRRMAAKCVTSLLGRLEKPERSELFSVTMVWFKDSQIAHRRLAAQLCGLFVESEKDDFMSRLPSLLPEVVAQFAPDLEIAKNGNEEDDDEEKARKKRDLEKMRDHHVYQVMQLVMKICNHCPGWIIRGDLSTFAANLTEHSQNLLAHPHEWVRLAAAQFLTVILNSIDATSLGEAANSLCKETEEVKLGYFQTNTRQRLKALTLDLCAQLVPGTEVREELLMQVVKNLVILANVLKDVKPSKGSDKEENDRTEGICLMWLVRRMRKAVNMEVVKAPQSTVVRTMVLNWAAAVAVNLSKEHVQSVLYHLMAPVTRELSIEDVPVEGSPQAVLRNLARDVGKIIKKAAGAQIYNTTQSQLRDKINSVQVERKMKRKQEAITDPELAAKRKIRKQQKKKETKKRQLLKLKGKKKFKSKDEDLEC